MEQIKGEKSIFADIRVQFLSEVARMLTAAAAVRSFEGVNVASEISPPSLIILQQESHQRNLAVMTFRSEQSVSSTNVSTHLVCGFAINRAARLLAPRQRELTRRRCVAFLTDVSSVLAF